MSLWGRIFAAGYDTFQASIERNFMGRIRDDLLAQASGSVIEIGAGTGVNLSHYPPSVTRLVCGSKRARFNGCASVPMSFLPASIGRSVSESSVMT